MYLEFLLRGLSLAKLRRLREWLQCFCCKSWRWIVPCCMQIHRWGRACFKACALYNKIMQIFTVKLNPTAVHIHITYAPTFSDCMRRAKKILGTSIGVGRMQLNPLLSKWQHWVLADQGPCSVTLEWGKSSHLCISFNLQLRGYRGLSVCSQHKWSGRGAKGSEHVFLIVSPLKLI